MQLEKRHEIHESLPPSLEELSLEYWEDFIYSQKTDDQIVQNDIERFWSHIEGLAVSTDRHLPVLKKLSIGELQEELVEFWEVKSFDKVYELLARAGIQLCCYFTGEVRGFDG